MKAKPIMWGTAEAFILIRRWQPVAHSFGWHLALAGGVLNNGYSYHDLDIMVIRMRGKQGEKANLQSCFASFEEVQHMAQPIAERPAIEGDCPSAPNDDPKWPIYIGFVGDKRIEFFVYDTGQVE